ncbi:hypothetical protein PENTCL1PPCAC_3346, partial [Pristionchus entomophagus]
NANMLIKGLSSIKELSEAYQKSVSALGSGWQSAIGAANAFVMGTGQTILMQLIFDNGHISWKAALASALIAGAIGGGRAGMNARKNARNECKDRKLIEKVENHRFLVDHEQGGTSDPKDAKNGPNDGVAGHKGCTIATRNEKNGNVEYGESHGKQTTR